MKKYLLITLLLFLKYTLYSQCNYERVARQDGSIVYTYAPKPIARDRTTEIGINLSNTGNENYISVVIRFKASALKIENNLYLRLENNNLMTFARVSSNITRLLDTNVTIGIFKCTTEQLDMLQKSRIKTISFYLSNKVLRTYECSENKAILKEQALCLNKQAGNGNGNKADSYIYRNSEEISGFKNFIFNTPVESYPEFDIKPEHGSRQSVPFLSCYRVLNLPTNLTVGEYQVNKIFLYCYDEKIIRIDVVFNSFDYKRLLQIFGVPNKAEHLVSTNIDNGEERASWQIPNSIIDYYHSWLTFQRQNSNSSSFTMNFPIYEYKLIFKTQKYDETIEIAKKKKSIKTFNDFNTPIN